MTPLQQLRVWWRRAPLQQRALTSVAAVVAVALLWWLAVPAESTTGAASLGTDTAEQPAGAPTTTVPQAGGTTTTTTSSTGTAPQIAGPTAGPGTAGQVPGAGPGTTGGGSTGAQSGTTTGGGTAKSCPTGTSDQGITSREARIAITIINIAGAAGNGQVGVPSPAVQEKEWNAVIKTINAAGGAGCRTLVPTYYSVNPIDPSDAQAKCLQIASAKPFLTIDSGALTGGVVSGSADCIPQQKIPLLGQGLSGDQIKAYYPYYLTANGLAAQTINNGVTAFKQFGYFGAGKGFKKLGIIYRTCIPTYYQALRASLKKAGVPDSAILTYSLGCPPAAQNTPADYQQAALTFKREGVTHVTEANVSNFVLFTKAAGQQRFKPQYLIADDGVLGTNEGSDQPDYANYDGAFVVAASRYGEDTTPGYKPGGETARCNAIMKANGFAPVYDQPTGYGGIVCAMLGTAKALLDHMPQANRAALVQGMHAIGKLDASYPGAPTDFSLAPPASGHGTSSWRPGKYVGSCRCYQITDTQFHPPFA